jgi:NET1-associated nuclear protein 1 (U3 small nucleolar RNA-associated protein 17)
VHRLTSTILLSSSHGSSLQIIMPSSLKLVSELEVAPSNRISRREDAPLSVATVDKAAISSSGDWMATVDSYDGSEATRPEVHLKIWNWDRKLQQWTLNSRVDGPHGHSSVSDLAFNSTSEELATSGYDGKVRIWKYYASKRKHEMGMIPYPRITLSHSITQLLPGSWAVRSSITCGHGTPNTLSWSPDDSLLLIGTARRVALCNPITATIFQILSTPECDRIQRSTFLGVKGRYVAISDDTNVLIWDLLLQLGE